MNRVLLTILVVLMSGAVSQASQKATVDGLEQEIAKACDAPNGVQKGNNGTYTICSEVPAVYQTAAEAAGKAFEDNQGKASEECKGEHQNLYRKDIVNYKKAANNDAMLVVSASVISQIQCK